MNRLPRLVGRAGCTTLNRAGIRLPILLFCFATTSCGDDSPRGRAHEGAADSGAAADARTTPVDLPELPAPIAPIENPSTPEKAELGRHLFYDTRLSAHENTSCATCHRQELAFTDGLRFSVGSTGEQTSRNSMSLVNSAYAATLTFANFLLVNFERQALVPLFGERPVEHGLANRDAEALERLRREPRYSSLFARAFPADPEPVSIANVVDALSSFERTLVSTRSPYDRFEAGDEGALSDAAKRGLELFESPRLGCKNCHGGVFFSRAMALPGFGPEAEVFENNGLYGRYPIGNQGLYDLTGREGDIGKFKPPSLRNVALTAPYMFDGSLPNLDAVLEHYARGGHDSPTKSRLINGFALSETERAELVEFLNSLTDQALVEDPRFEDPW